MKPAFLKNFTAGASKYQNKKIEIDGVTFDSKKEAKVYGELKLLKQSGEIKDFTRQQTFELIPSQYEIINGKKKCVEKPVQYKADFVVEHLDGEKSVVDVKGMRLPVYVIKRKLMRYLLNINIKEV
jgi:hypothetical protein